MKKRLLSMILVVSMVSTLLPVPAMAKKAPAAILASEEIIAFAPLEETGETVTIGTSIQGLGLPETLTATVRTAFLTTGSASEESVQDYDSVAEEEDDMVTATPSFAIEAEVREPRDEGVAIDLQWEETDQDIPVKWTSKPKYDMEAEGEYVFTPVIEGFTVSAELPEIKVTVETGEMIPRTVLAVSNEIDSLSSLQNAINEAADDLELMLSNDYDETGTLTIASGNGYDITIDLNGQVLDGGNGSAIKHNGSGTLTINDTAGEGKVTSTMPSDNGGVIYLNGGGLILDGATVSANQGTAIFSDYGDVNIWDGTVESTGFGIVNRGSGKVSILGGTVSSIAKDAIYNLSHSELSISGGTVNSISGYGIYSNGDIIIPSGSVIIKGDQMAMNKAPYLDSYFNVSITAYTNYDETSPVLYKEKDIKTYKYLEFEAAPLLVRNMTTGTSYYDLQVAIDGIMENDETIMLLDNINLMESVAIVSDNNKSFTLDLNGKTLSGSYYSAISHKGSGMLTITDSSEDETGVVTTQQGSAAISLNGGSLTITSGTVDNTSNPQGIAIYNDASGKIIIPSGSPVIRASRYAMNKPPELGYYKNLYVTASTNYDGSSPVPYDGYYIFDYKYLTFGLAPFVAQNSTTGTGYSNLQEAVNEIGTNDETIMLLDNINLSATLNIAEENDKSFTLDLNGKTLNGEHDLAISHNGSGTLTIADNSDKGDGKVTSGNWGINREFYGTINLNGGSLAIVSGTVENNINGSGCTAIYNRGSGEVSVSGGTVKSLLGCAINNEGKGKINISGNAKVTSQNTTYDSGTIRLSPTLITDVVLVITGGTIENTAAGNAIYNSAYGKITIPSGSPVIKGGRMAMNVAPDLSSYTNVKVTASKSSSGVTIAHYDDYYIRDYRYLTFETASIIAKSKTTEEEYHFLEEAFTKVQNDDTIELLDNITLTAAVDIINNTGKSFTLDLKGKTVDSGSNTAINYSGVKGTLTITDSVGGGKITSSYSSYGNSTIYLLGKGTENVILKIDAGTVENKNQYGGSVITNDGATVNVTGGTVSNIGKGSAISNIYGCFTKISGGIVDGGSGTAISSGDRGKIIISDTAKVTSAIIDSRDYNPSGTIYLSPATTDKTSLEITGGVIENTADGTAIYNMSLGTVSISGGLIRATAPKSNAIYNESAGKILINDGIVENTSQGYAIQNVGTGSVSISGGRVSAKNGTAIFSTAPEKGLLISGGMVSSENGIAIDSYVVDILGGTSIICGSEIALYAEPDLSTFQNVQITGSMTSKEGSDALPLSPMDIDTWEKAKPYKYLKFEPAAEVKFDIWVGGTQVTNYTTSGIGWAYTPHSKTLTLNGASINNHYVMEAHTEDGKSSAAAIYASKDLNLVLANTNVVTAPDHTTGHSYAICVKGNLTISGSGALTATGGAADSGSNTFTSYGIYADTITVNGGMVNAEVKPTESPALSIGLCGTTSVTINDGFVTAVGGETAYQSNGVRTGKCTINGGFLRGEGGRVTGDDSPSSYGIYINQDGSLAIPHGGLTAVGYDKGLHLGTNAAFTSGRVTISAGNDPTTAAAIASADLLKTESYPFVMIEPVVIVAKNKVTGAQYATLEEAFAKVDNEQIIELLDTIIFDDTITIPKGHNKSFTLDLNGKTLFSGSIVIDYLGSGTLTITDTGSGEGKIVSTISDSDAGTIRLSEGSLVVSGGTVENTSSNYGNVIINKGPGTVSVTGGTVESNANSSYCAAIFNTSTGSVNVEGGNVKAAGGSAIVNSSIGKITISNFSKITSAQEDLRYGTIALLSGTASDNVLELKGGDIINTGIGFAINHSEGTSGNVRILGSGVLIKGGYMATDIAPDVSGLVNKLIFSHPDVTGVGHTLIDEEKLRSQITTYKFLLFIRGADVTVTNLILNGKLTAPVKNMQPSSIFTGDAQYSGTVSWNENPVNFLGGTAYTATVTLTANEGYTFKNLAANRFILSGSAVTHDSGSGKTIILTIKFPKTVPRILQSIVITVPPSKSVYQFGDIFNQEGIAVKAIYDDGTEDGDFTGYTVDKTGPLKMGDTRVTITAKGNNTIKTTQSIIINKADNPDKPNVTFSFDGLNPNRLMGATVLMEYSLNGGSDWSDCSVNMNLASSLASITANNDIKVRLKESGTHTAGAEQVIEITKPSAPTGIIASNDTLVPNNGTITGVSSMMEYKKSSGTSYIPITENMITGLSAGTYYVRYKAAGTKLPSLEATVTIEKSLPVADDLNYSLDPMTFDGSAKPLAVSKKNVEIGDITVKYDGSINAPVSAGNYDVTVEIESNESYHGTKLNLGTYSVNKAKVSAAANNSASVAFNETTSKTHMPSGLPANAGTAVYAKGSVADTGNILQSSSVDSSTGQVTYQLVPSLTSADAGKTATIPVTVTSQNYVDFTVNVVVKVVNKTDVSSSITFANGNATYNGNVQIHETAMTTDGSGGVFTYTYTTGDGALEDGKPRGAGTYTVTAAYESATAKGSKTAAFHIYKKPVTVAVSLSPSTITAGDVLPTPTLSYDGMVSGESLTMSEAPVFMGIPGDSSTAGTYTISWSNTAAIKSGIEALSEAENYTITYRESTNLVIKKKSSGSESHSSGGGSGGSPSVSSTPPVPGKPNSPTQWETKVFGTVDNKGNVTVNITSPIVSGAFDKALEEARKNGNELNGIALVLRVDTGNKTVSNVTVNLPKTVQDTIIIKNIVNTTVVLDNPGIRVGMDLAAVQAINSQAKSDVNITAACTDNSKLTDDAKRVIGSRPVLDLKVDYGSGNQLQSFGSGTVSITIPYILGTNEKAGNVQAVYVDGNGRLHWLTNSVYDSVEQVLRFRTNHFSTYGIGYKQTDTEFTDITGHWAKEDIEFAVSRGLVEGTSAVVFSPEAGSTRGIFVTALGRLANADVSSYKESSFTDVKNDAYYMGYIEWASKNSILNGTGNGEFVPDESISREQMAVIIKNYAKAIGFVLPKVYMENTFADSVKINSYAKDAVKEMQMAGVISSKNCNLFEPQDTATRAEVSAALRRFVGLAISNETMQGWTMNDSGQWVYYENGRLITGKKDIDGMTYTFDKYGVTADAPKD